MRPTRSVVAVVLLFLVGHALYAGDVASFVNLGFSPDGSQFMFGQYGFSNDDNTNYAQTYLINTPGNRYEPGGVASFSKQKWPEAGASSEGALFVLLDRTLAIRRKYAIDHSDTGRLLYYATDTEDEASGPISFRDFQNSKSYDLTLTQTEDPGGGVGASYSIQIDITDKNGAVKNVRAGSPNMKRKGVTGYSVRRAILAPNKDYLIIVVAKIMTSTRGGANVRYMVESVAL